MRRLTAILTVFALVLALNACASKQVSEEGTTLVNDGSTRTEIIVETLDSTSIDAEQANAAGSTTDVELDTDPNFSSTIAQIEGNENPKPPISGSDKNTLDTEDNATSITNPTKNPEKQPVSTPTPKPSGSGQITETTEKGTTPTTPRASGIRRPTVSSIPKTTTQSATMQNYPTFDAIKGTWYVVGHSKASVNIVYAKTENAVKYYDMRADYFDLYKMKLWSKDPSSGFGGNTGYSFWDSLCEQFSPKLSNGVLSLTSGGNTLKFQRTATWKSVTSIVMDQTELNFTANPGSVHLTATVKPLDFISDNSVVWSSSNEDVAAILSVPNGVTDINGQTSVLVDVKKEGVAVITATTNDGGLKASCKITFKAPNRVTPDYPTFDAIKGTWYVMGQSKASVNISYSKIENGVKHYDIVSDSFDLSTMQFGSNDQGGGQGYYVDWDTLCMFFSPKLSNGVLTLTSSDGNSLKFQKIPLKPVTSIVMNQTELNFATYPSYFQELVATVTPKDFLSDNRVVWSSSNEDVAAILSDPNGVTDINGQTSVLVDVKKEGVAVITATTNDGGFKASCKITFKIPKSITLDQQSFSLHTGSTTTLTPVLTPDWYSHSSITWSSSNPAVATVSNSGQVKGVSPGQSVITASVNNGEYKASATVTVSYAPLQASGGVGIVLFGGSQTPAGILGTVKPSGGTGIYTYYYLRLYYGDELIAETTDTTKSEVYSGQMVFGTFRVEYTVRDSAGSEVSGSSITSIYRN